MQDSKPAKAFSAYEWAIAGRLLKSRRREGFVSVIAGFSLVGIALGVATLIIVMAVMNGFRHELLGKILGVNGHAIVQSYTGEIVDWAGLSDKLLKVEGVNAAYPQIEGQVMATFGNRANGVLARGMRADDVRSLKHMKELQQGSLADFTGYKIALGDRLADMLGVRIGDTVSLITPQGRETPFGRAPRIVGFEVTAIFSIGMSEYDRTFVYLPLDAAQRYFTKGNSVTAIELMVDNPDGIYQITNRINTVLDDQVYDPNAVDRNLRVLDWTQLNSTFFSALQVERNVMFLILSLIVLVAALNMIAGLIMLVKDKGRDIAILRTMGVPAGGVMRIFLIAGASIGTIGTLSGVALGVLFCTYIEELRQGLSSLLNTELFSPEVYFLSRMPAEMDVSEVVSVCVMALVLTFVATLYPAWRAARLDPVEALRYE